VRRGTAHITQYSSSEAQFFPYEGKGTFKIMEYTLSARVVKAYVCLHTRRQIDTQYPKYSRFVSS